jgi:hypothetical protein
MFVAFLCPSRKISGYYLKIGHDRFLLYPFQLAITEPLLQVLNIMKIRPVGAELFHMDGRTDMTKLIVGFRNFANAPKNLRNNNMNITVANLMKSVHRSRHPVGRVPLVRSAASYPNIT